MESEERRVKRRARIFITHKTNTSNTRRTRREGAAEGEGGGRGGGAGAGGTFSSNLSEVPLPSKARWLQMSSPVSLKYIVAAMHVGA